MSKRVEFYIRDSRPLVESYHYTACGLNNIYLTNGVSILPTPDGSAVIISNLGGLQHAIGIYIAEKQEPMSGPEFRFLRKQMKLTQQDLAMRMKISNQTIANYEKENTALGPAEPLMRLIYLLHVMPNEWRVSLLKKITENLGDTRVAILSDSSRRKLAENWQKRVMEAA
jgi:transcriptional regulator with XRE-family HTH domain